MQCRPIIFIRFNPDKYTKKDTTIPSCWTRSKKVSILKPKRKEKMVGATTQLKNVVLNSIKHVPSQPIGYNTLPLLR